LLPHAPCIAAATHARRKGGPARAGAQLINGGWLEFPFVNFVRKKKDGAPAGAGRRRVAACRACGSQMLSAHGTLLARVL
jgi:hypothetical protein